MFRRSVFYLFFLRNLSHIFIVSYTSRWQFAILCLLDYFILCISVQKSSVWGCAENYFRRCCCLHKSLLKDFPWKRIWLFFFSKYFSQQFPLRSTTCGRFPHYEPNTSVQTGSLYATHLIIFYTADWHTSWIQIKILIKNHSSSHITQLSLWSIYTSLGLDILPDSTFSTGERNHNL